MTYRNLLEEVHNKCLKMRQTRALIHRDDFKIWWDSLSDKDRETHTKQLLELDYEIVLALLRKAGPIEKLSRRRLRELASQYGIPQYSRMTRAQLIGEIKDVQQARNNQRNQRDPDALP